MKQQQHDINFEEDSQMGFEPTTHDPPIWDSDFFPSPPQN